MKRNLGVVELQELCYSITDCHHSTPLYTETGKIVIRNFNIKNGRLLLEDVSFTDESHFEQRIARAKPEAGDLIITREAPMGEVCIIPENLECCLGQRMVLIKPNPKKVCNKFLLYSLLSNYCQTQIKKSEGTGSIVSNLRIPVLKELHIPNLPLHDQQKIAKVLSDLDAKIELNNRINAELEAMAKLVYEYWFVQFDFPFDGAQGKPDQNGKPYKSSGGKMVWNEELKREIPEGWRSGTISDIASLTRGVTYDKDDIKDESTSGTIPILRATNITRNQIDLNSMVYVSESIVDEDQILKPFDILITMSSGSIDHIGKNGFYLFKEKVAFGAFCAKIEALEDFEFYLYSYTQSDFFFTTIKNECLGTNINNLNGSMVKGFKMVIPDNSTLTKFKDHVKPLFEKIRINANQNLQLSTLRDWLLPMLMNGQVSVAEAEERVEQK